MSRVRAPDRKQSPFEVRDFAMFQLVKWVHELDYLRNFGLKIRYARTPKNWDKWSIQSKAAWMQREADRIERLRKLDTEYLHDARIRVQRALDDLLFHIAKANRYRKPRTIEEANKRLTHQQEAAGACDALRIALQDIYSTIPTDKNWLTQVEPMIENEIALIEGWIKGDGEMRKNLYALEEGRGQKIIRKGVEEAAEGMVLRAIYKALGIETEGNS